MRKKKTDDSPKLNLGDILSPQKTKKKVVKKASTKTAGQRMANKSSKKTIQKKVAKKKVKQKAIKKKAVATPKAKEVNSNIIPLHPEIPIEAFIYMEGRDNEQIEKEIRGLATGSLCYAFRGKVNKKDQSGNFIKDQYGKYEKYEVGPIIADLSISGYKKVRLEYGSIQFNLDKIKIDRDDPGIIAIYVEGVDLRTQNTIIGSGSSVLMIKRGGDNIPDPFARQKALSKAQRNATRGLVPQDIIDSIIHKYLVENCKTNKDWPVWSYPEPIRKAVAEELNNAGITGKTTKAVTKDKPKESKVAISDPMRKRMFALLGKADYKHEQLKEYLIVAYNIKSTKDITHNQYGTVIDLIENRQLIIKTDRLKEASHKTNKKTA